MTNVTKNDTITSGDMEHLRCDNIFQEDKELKICDERTLKIISHYNKHGKVYDGLCLA